MNFRPTTSAMVISAGNPQRRPSGLSGMAAIDEKTLTSSQRGAAQIPETGPLSAAVFARGDHRLRLGSLAQA
jgi:hypothetical protein